MAEASPVQGLQEVATCSICLEYYTDPVTTKCGHNFCRSCISVCSQGAGAALPCPLCRELCPQGDLRTNRELQSMVQLVKQLSVQQERPPEEDLCEEHEEKLKLFCEEDEKLICVVCQVSSDHEQHKVRPVKEAAQKYKRELQDSLKPLRKQLEAIRQCKQKEGEESRTLKNKLEAERRKIKAEFEGLRQLLNEMEQALLRRIEEMEKKITTVEDLKIAKLTTEMSSLEELLREIEKKCEQPPGELLKDIRSTLNRSRRQLKCGATEEPRQHHPHTLLIQRVSRFRHTGKLRVPRSKHELTNPTPEQIKKNYKVLITLDADTAHGHLALSGGSRCVRRTDTDQHWPDNPKRFIQSTCVLGREAFTSGRHYWELELLRDGAWTVGVARESVSRKESVTESPKEGVWAVQGCSGQYWALTSPASPLNPSQYLKKLGVYLDYGGQRLSMYNADTLEELYTFTGAAFTERVYPYFWVGTEADLHLV